jgi:hypothetical protein
MDVVQSITSTAGGAGNGSVGQLQVASALLYVVSLLGFVAGVFSISLNVPA